MLVLCHKTADQQDRLALLRAAGLDAERTALMYSGSSAAGCRCGFFAAHSAVDIFQEGSLHGGQGRLRLFCVVEHGAADGEGIAINLARRHGQADFLAIEIDLARQHGRLAWKQGRELSVGAAIVAPVEFRTAGGQDAGGRERSQQESK